MKYIYCVCYALDTMDRDRDYTSDVNTKREIRKQLKELKKEYGDRLVLVDVEAYENDEGTAGDWAEGWAYDSIEDALANF